MEEVAKYILSIESLNKCLQDAENIVIYGVGNYGKCLIDYIISIEEEKKIKGIVVTEKKITDCEYKGIEIHDAGAFFSGCGECYVFIAASLPYQDDMAIIVNQYHKEYRYITNELYMDLTLKIDSRILEPYSGIEFLCAGFFKCGTTSLHSALKTIDSIYLPVIKESHFFAWYDDVEDPEKILIKKVFNNIRKGQKVGMIEPSFIDSAKRVYDFFGDKIKIIFLVRNPVDAAFSGFKMNNREGMGKMDAAYQSRDGKFNVEIFDEFFERSINEETALDWEYTYWINQFNKLYAKEQMKIVIFEELIRNPQVIINDILKFIGCSEKYRFEKLPLENEGDFVMADIEGYKLGRLVHDWYLEDHALSLEDVRKRRYEKHSEYSEMIEKYKQAKRIYGTKMLTEQRRRVEKYFDRSVRELEEFINRDLSNLWF